VKKFVAELIGTFMLVYIGTGAVVFGNGLDGLGHLGIAFVFGLAIVVAAYSIGTVSGAHLIRAFLASASVFFLLSNSGMSTASLGENSLANGVTVFGGFLFEVVATFLFVLVIMTVTSASKRKWRDCWFGNRFVLDGDDSCRIEHYWTFSKPSS